MYRAEFRLPNGSCGIIIGDFHAFDTVGMALRGNCSPR